MRSDILYAIIIYDKPETVQELENRILKLYPNTVIELLELKSIQDGVKCIDNLNPDVAFLAHDVSSNNQFEITTSVPNVKVSWQIMGVRNDPYMQNVNSMQVEEDKPIYMKGKYLSPSAYNKPDSMGAFYIPTDKNLKGSNNESAQEIQNSKERLDATKATVKKIKAKVAQAKKELESKNNSKTDK